MPSWEPDEDDWADGYCDCCCCRGYCDGTYDEEDDEDE